MLVVRAEIEGQLERYVDEAGHLERALRHVDAADGGLLQWWDPYGDVVYNDRQSLTVASEIRDLLVVCPPELHDALCSVLRLAERVAEGRRCRLTIVGD